MTAIEIEIVCGDRGGDEEEEEEEDGEEVQIVRLSGGNQDR